MSHTLHDAISPLIGDSTVLGAVAMTANRSGTLESAAVGIADPASGASMKEDTVFQIASMTKAVTSVAAMQLVERGLIGLDDPVGTHLPALAEPQVLEGFADDGSPQLRPAKSAITLRHLLTHTSGLGYAFLSADMARAQGEVAPGSLASLDTPLLFDPGEKWNYGISTDWAGLLVEAVSGVSLGDYFAEHILGPLKMDATGFDAPKDSSKRAALQLRTPAGFAPMPVEIGGGPSAEFQSGGGGLYSTARDYLRFCRMVLNEGTLDGATIVQPATIAQMATNQIGSLRAGRMESIIPEFAGIFDQFPAMDTKWGLGFLLLPEAGPAGRTAGSLSWAGIANSYYWIDHASDRCGVVMMQFLPFGDPAALKVFEATERAAYAV